MTITIIGSGNVATHLAKTLYKRNFLIDAVYSRDLQHANTLSQQVNAACHIIEDEIKCSSNIIIISIPDDAIISIINSLVINRNTIVLHTSGSVDMSVFANKCSCYGVVYPLQTFNRNQDIDFAQVPLCIESSDTNTHTMIEHLANTLSPGNIHHINSTQRRQLHLAAVFACNFTNAMYTIANDLLTTVGFDLLKPLIIETTQKAATTNNPSSLQTGPAKRGDQTTMDRHLSMLSTNPEYQQLYTLISHIISKKTSLN